VKRRRAKGEKTAATERGTEGERNRYIDDHDDYEPVACVVRVQQCVTNECVRACVRACVRTCVHGRR